MEKRSHLGMSGHYAAMSEFLYRGYNVAAPAVDVGDDAYVVEDGGGTMWRLQVKTADGTPTTERDGAGNISMIRGQYMLSRDQLGRAKANELFFMFMIRWHNRWRFVLISRPDLRAIRGQFEAADRTGKRGPRPKPDSEATSDSLGLIIEWRQDDATGWGASFSDHLDQWPATFSENPDGPGATTASAPSPDPETQGSPNDRSEDP